MFIRGATQTAERGGTYLTADFSGQKAPASSARLPQEHHTLRNRNMELVTETMSVIIKLELSQVI